MSRLATMEHKQVRYKHCAWIASWIKHQSKAAAMDSSDALLDNLLSTAVVCRWEHLEQAISKSPFWSSAAEFVMHSKLFIISVHFLPSIACHYLN